MDDGSTTERTVNTGGIELCASIRGGSIDQDRKLVESLIGRARLQGYGVREKNQCKEKTGREKGKNQNSIIIEITQLDTKPSRDNVVMKTRREILRYLSYSLTSILPRTLFCPSLIFFSLPIRQTSFSILLAYLFLSLKKPFATVFGLFSLVSPLYILDIKPAGYLVKVYTSSFSFSFFLSSRDINLTFPSRSSPFPFSFSFFPPLCIPTSVRDV